MSAKALILPFCLISNFLFAQAPAGVLAMEDKEFGNYFLRKTSVPIVRGKIVNLTPEEIKQVKIKYSIVTPFEGLQTTKNGNLNADGTFELNLDYAFPYQQIWLSVGDLFYTGIYANEESYIELDAKQLKLQKEPSFNAAGVKFLGKDGALNVYKNNHILYQREKQLKLYQLIWNFKYERTDNATFIRKYDSLYSFLHQLDDDYIKQNPSDLYWVVKNERQSEYFDGLCIHYFGKQMPADLFERVKKHVAFLTSNDGMQYYNYVLMYLTSIPNKSNKGSTIVSRTAQTINMLDSLFTTAKSDFLKIRLTDKDPNERKKILELVLASVKTEWCQRIIRDQYDQNEEKLRSINSLLSSSKPIALANPLGQPMAELSFGAKLYKVDSLDAKTLLSNLKSSFPNKALLIDMWATWCAPCIAEFPHSKKLNESTRDLPVEFVYLCTSEGSTIEKWKTKIAEFELRGTHIYVAKNIESKLLEMFSGGGFPTYAFINRNGEYKPGAIDRVSNVDKEKLAALAK